MSYECVCDGDDISPYYYTRRQIKSAMKPHKCCECRRIIEIGESYERTDANYEGWHYTFKVCCDCIGLREWATISVPCFCWSHESLLENIREMVANVRSEVPGFFFEYGRRVVAIRRRRAKVDTGAAA